MPSSPARAAARVRDRLGPGGSLFVVVLIVAALTSGVAWWRQQSYERDISRATLQQMTVVRGQDGEGTGCTIVVRRPGEERTHRVTGAPCGFQDGADVLAWVSPKGRVTLNEPPNDSLRRAHVVLAAVLSGLTAALLTALLGAIGMWAWGRWRYR